MTVSCEYVNWLFPILFNVLLYGGPCQCSKTKGKNKKYKAYRYEKKSKIVLIHKWQDFLHRKTKESTKNHTTISMWSEQACKTQYVQYIHWHKTIGK